VVTKFDARRVNLAHAAALSVVRRGRVVALATIPRLSCYPAALRRPVTQLLIVIPRLLRLQKGQPDQLVNRLHPHKDTFFSES
jgi:hypothetical protein